MTDQLDVIGIGHCNIDYLGVTERYPEVDVKEELAEFSIQGGGPTATATVTCSLFGLKTAFMGKIGDDDFGEFIRKGLEATGVDTRGLVTEPGKISPFSFISVEGETGKRTIFWTRGNLSPLNPEEMDLEVVGSARALLVDGHQLRAQLAAVDIAREHGVPVVLDAGGKHEGIEELVRACDILIASERYAAEHSGGAIKTSLERLAGMGRAKTVVITLGEEGSVGYQDGETIITSGHQVKAADTTGAGDVYHGAYIYGMLQGWGLQRTMSFANLAAALSCRQLGGRAGIPELSEVLKLL